MRRLGFAVGLLTLAGCLSPFSWPEDRRSAEQAAVGTSGPMPIEPIPTTVPDPARSEDHLTMAAEKLDRGDEAGALGHLRAHVAAHPDAVMIRAYLAELHLKLGNREESRGEFERVVGTAQHAKSGPARRHLVHCHTRLMEIAQTEDDAFAEQLHRGIGLWLLVREWDADPERRDETAAEQTLAKAASALRKAKEEKSGEARANLYLSLVLDRLGQPGAANSARRAARVALPDATLTPWEREQLATE